MISDPSRLRSRQLLQAAEKSALCIYRGHIIRQRKKQHVTSWTYAIVGDAVLRIFQVPQLQIRSHMSQLRPIRKSRRFRRRRVQTQIKEWVISVGEKFILGLVAGLRVPHTNYHDHYTYVGVIMVLTVLQGFVNQYSILEQNTSIVMQFFLRDNILKYIPGVTEYVRQSSGGDSL